MTELIAELIEIYTQSKINLDDPQLTESEFILRQCPMHLVYSPHHLTNKKGYIEFGNFFIHEFVCYLLKPKYQQYVSDWELYQYLKTITPSVSTGYLRDTYTDGNPENMVNLIYPQMWSSNKLTQPYLSEEDFILSECPDCMLMIENDESGLYEQVGEYFIFHYVVKLLKLKYVNYKFSFGNFS